MMGLETSQVNLQPAKKQMKVSVCRTGVGKAGLQSPFVLRLLVGGRRWVLGYSSTIKLVLCIFATKEETLVITE